MTGKADFKAIISIAAMVFSCALPFATPALAQAAPSLPGGASSLQKTYQDFACRIANGARLCVVSQQQTQQKGQRVLAIELAAPSGNTVSGTLVLPFGLALDSGVTFQIDDKPAMQPILAQRRSMLSVSISCFPLMDTENVS